MPFLVAASRSTLSTPVPALPTTCSFSAALMTSAVTLVAERTMRPSQSWSRRRKSWVYLLNLGDQKNYEQYLLADTEYSKKKRPPKIPREGASNPVFPHFKGYLIPIFISVVVASVKGHEWTRWLGRVGCRDKTGLRHLPTLQAVDPGSIPSTARSSLSIEPGIAPEPPQLWSSSAPLSEYDDAGDEYNGVIYKKRWNAAIDNPMDESRRNCV